LSSGFSWIIDFDPTPQYLAAHKVMLAIDFGYRKSSWLFIVKVAPLEWVVFDQLGVGTSKYG
jgi:hypothetical protein